MQHIYATQAASISELKKNPSQLIDQAGGQPVAILNHNNATAYLIPAETFERLLDLLDDQALQRIVGKRLHDNKKPIKVSINEL